MSLNTRNSIAHIHKIICYLRALFLKIGSAICKGTLNLLFYVGIKFPVTTRYPFNFSVEQLLLLCSFLRETDDVTGNIVEVGCERGSTTLFLCNYLASLKSSKKYFSVDTFEGFVDTDIKYEVAYRSKEAWMYSAFRVNSVRWFTHSMKMAGEVRVQAICSDVNSYDFTLCGPFSFILLDVDLYKPIREKLPELYSLLSPGGIMVVDDCNPRSYWWDGAYQAYDEFVKDNDLDSEIVLEKIGIIRKPLQ